MHIFDPNAFEDTDRADLVIKNPITLVPTSMSVVIAGPEHADRKRLRFERQRKLRAALAETGCLPPGDPADDEAEELEHLVACTIGWSGSVDPYSVDACRRLYADPKRRWLRKQVRDGLERLELFMRSSVGA